MIKRSLIFFIFLSTLLVSWHDAVDTKLVSSFLLPYPKDVLLYLIAAAKDGTLWTATKVTFIRLIEGYALGLLIGLHSWNYFI
ncbi:MAG: hypothetical protein SGJ02_14400 [bacterium]|nr:hypothetical protein [bacterium]